MRAPRRVKGQSKRDRVSLSRSYPAPVGGWNARDALADMEPVDALDLVNWFPRTSDVIMRGGSSDHATGMSGTGKTLAVYNKFDGGKELFASTENFIYDVTSNGAVGAGALARTNGKHQWVTMGDGTNQWLIMLNGVDKPAYYNGTAWTAVDSGTSPALTGIASTELVDATLHKGRLFFLAKNSLVFWYLPAGAAGGTLTDFDLSAVAKEGGYLIAVGTWTIDGGDGPDDRIVFVTSQGEVIVYAGTNPGDAAAWSLVGNYQIGDPLGRRCLSKLAGDLLILTENGVFPMSSAIQSETIDYKQAVSFKIENAFNLAALSYGSNFGWKAQLLPSQSALLVNIPKTEDGEHEQYVMNTITKAWCKFTGWNAEDLTEFNRELYYIEGTKVVKAWTGPNDNGSNVTYYGKTAFNYLRDMMQVKKFKLYKPVLSVNGSVSFLTDIDVDFEDKPMMGSAATAATNSGVFGTAVFGTDVWTGSDDIVQQWTSPPANEGRCAAFKLQITSKTLSAKWLSNDVVYEKGNLL